MNESFLHGLNEVFAKLCQDHSYTEPSYQEIDKEKHLSPRLNETKVMLAFSKIKKIASAPHSIPHSVWRDNALLLAPIHGLRHGKSLTYCASDVILQYLSWSSTNHMPCNLSQFKELFWRRKDKQILVLLVI